MKFLNLDSPLMQALGKMADLMILNLITIVCCLPIFTIGASLTAMNYMALKIARDEECYIVKGFFKSFKQNFKQATIIWLIFLFVLLMIAADFFILRQSTVPYMGFFRILLFVTLIIAVFILMFVFPILARFDNPIKVTIKNAFIISIMQLPKTILMVVMYAIPVVMFIFVNGLMPIAFLFGLAVPAWGSAKLYSGFFKKLEDQIIAANQPEEEPEGEDERIFKDELDATLVDRDMNQ